MFPSHLLFIPIEIIRIIEELEGRACLVHTDMKPTLVVLCCSVAQSCLTLQLHGLQHTRLPCPLPSPGACSLLELLSTRCLLSA